MKGLQAEVEFAADQAMRLAKSDGEAVGQEADAALLIAAADVGDHQVSACRQTIRGPVKERMIFVFEQHAPAQQVGQARPFRITDSSS